MWTTPSGGCCLPLAAGSERGCPAEGGGEGEGGLMVTLLLGPEGRVVAQTWDFRQPCCSSS